MYEVHYIGKQAEARLPGIVVNGSKGAKPQKIFSSKASFFVPICSIQVFISITLLSFLVEVVSYFSSCGWKMSWRDVLSQSKVEKCFGAMQHSWQMTPRKSVYDLGGNLPATISDSQTLQARIRRNIKRQILLCYSVLHPCQNRRQLLTLHGFAAIPFV